MEYEITFDPVEMRDLYSPEYRNPVRILHAGKAIGHYYFSEENVFQIWLYANYVNRPGWRELLLKQTFSHEDKCRDWLIHNIDIALDGLELHHLD